MKRFLKQTLVTSVAAILLLPVAVSAHEGHNHTEEGSAPRTATSQESNKSAERFKQMIEQQRQTAKEKLESVKAEEIKQKLNNVKREICSKHIVQINSVMKNMNERRQKTFDRITEVYESVKTFSMNKKLSNADYESLAANVEAAKAEAADSMTAQQATPVIDCSSGQPKADIAGFKAKRSSSIDAMQTYRQSVKELIKSVKETAKAGEVQ